MSRTDTPMAAAYQRVLAHLQQVGPVIGGDEVTDVDEHGRQPGGVQAGGLGGVEFAEPAPLPPVHARIGIDPAGEIKRRMQGDQLAACSSRRTTCSHGPSGPAAGGTTPSATPAHRGPPRPSGRHSSRVPSGCRRRRGRSGPPEVAATGSGQIPPGYCWAAARLSPGPRRRETGAWAASAAAGTRAATPGTGWPSAKLATGRRAAILQDQGDIDEVAPVAHAPGGVQRRSLIRHGRRDMAAARVRVGDLVVRGRARPGGHLTVPPRPGQTPRMHCRSPSASRAGYGPRGVLLVLPGLAGLRNLVWQDGAAAGANWGNIGQSVPAALDHAGRTGVAVNAGSRARKPLPGRLTDAEQAFYQELRRLTGLAGFSARMLERPALAASTRRLQPLAVGPLAERGSPACPCRSSRGLAELIGGKGFDAGNLPVLWRQAFAAAPPARPGQGQPPRPYQLPPAVAHFSGRAAELQILAGLADQAAAAGGAVVITAIGGTAGIGKTALAVHWAHQAADRFPGRAAVPEPARI